MSTLSSTLSWSLKSLNWELLYFYDTRRLRAMREREREKMGATRLSPVILNLATICATHSLVLTFRVHCTVTMLISSSNNSAFVCAIFLRLAFWYFIFAAQGFARRRPASCNQIVPRYIRTWCSATQRHHETTAI